MNTRVKLAELSPEALADLKILVDRFFERQTGLDADGVWENDATGAEVIGFLGAANLLTHLEWEGYEYGYQRISSFEALAGLSVACLSKLLGCRPGRVSLDGVSRMCIIAVDIAGRPIPLMLEDHLLGLLARPQDDSFDGWYVSALTRTPANWTSDVFPAIRDSPWTPTTLGVVVPDPVRDAWLAATARCRGPVGDGTGVVRRLGLQAPLAIIKKDWEALLGVLDSLPREHW